MSARKDERAATMYALYQQGLSCSEVATRFGISRQTVQVAFRQRGWPMRDRLEALHAAAFLHGMKDSRAYSSWQNAKSRVTNPNNPAWRNYGGRGITMCTEWAGDFQAFYADMGDPDVGMTLDRIDVNGPYSPDNCRWADRKTQGRNQRDNLLITSGGRTQTLADWAEELGINYWTLHSRVRRGWSDERVLEVVTHGRV